MSFESEPLARLGTGRRVGLGIVFLWFFIGAWAHFLATGFEVHITPPWVPYPLAAVYVSGVLELIGAVGLLFVRTRRTAGALLMLVTVAVTAVHTEMLRFPERFPAIPLWALWARLPLQAALLWLIAWSTGWLGQLGADRDRRRV